MALLIILITILTVPLWGYLLLRNSLFNASPAGWVIAIGLNLSIFFFVQSDPVTQMFLYISATFLALKIVVANNRLDKKEQLNFIQWLLFSYTWFGMNPVPFKTFPARPLPKYGYYLRKGATRMVFGLVLIILTGKITAQFPGTLMTLLSYLLYLIGLSFILHFGILNISTGLLRLAGVNVHALFKDPAKSSSLQEFWSKRWNIAFVELTTIAVLRPLKQRFGARAAFWGSYIFSGLLHELAISLPVRTGYGKPFAYFIIQAILILGVEKYFIKDISSTFIKKIWLFACLFLPIFLLFHEAFILQIVLPLVNHLRLSL